MPAVPTVIMTLTRVMSIWLAGLLIPGIFLRPHTGDFLDTCYFIIIYSVIVSFLLAPRGVLSTGRTIGPRMIFIRKTSYFKIQTLPVYHPARVFNFQHTPVSSGSQVGRTVHPHPHGS